MTIVKECKKHGFLTSDECKMEKSDRYYCYRCIYCKREKDKHWKENNREKHRASAGKARKESRRLYREGLINEEPKANKWVKEDRLNNPEKHKLWAKIGREKLGSLRNIREIARRRGITVDQYYELVNSYDNKCAICRNEETKKARKDGIARLTIDHCHNTNKVRGLLCHACNVGIGYFKESIPLLESAIDYLQRFAT